MNLCSCVSSGPSALASRARNLAVVLGASVVLQSAPAFADAHDAHDAHGSVEGHESADAHGTSNGHASHDGHHVPHFSDINWMYGFLGEKEGVTPSLLYRPKGMPIPLGALLLNTAVLFFLIGRLGSSGIKKGLVGRKERIAGEIERAAKMKEEAQKQLSHYEDKLSHMASELKRIKSEMAEQARVQRDKVLAEARQRRSVIEAEARQLIEQELAHARQEATARAVSAAVSAAREEIKKNLNPQDQERLSEKLLSALEAHVGRAKEARS